MTISFEHFIKYWITPDWKLLHIPIRNGNILDKRTNFILKLKVCCDGNMYKLVWRKKVADNVMVSGLFIFYHLPYTSYILSVFHYILYSHTHIHADTYVCMYIYVYIYIHTHIYMCVCIHTYIYQKMLSKTE